MLVNDQWSYWRIFAMNSAMVGLQIYYTIAGLLLNAYLTGALGLRPAVVSGLNVVGPICGFFVQPLVGMLSDMTTLRCGPRRPYIVAGSLLMAVACSLMISAGYGTNMTLRQVRCSVAMVLGYIGMNSVPYRALNNDVLPPESRDKGNSFASISMGLVAMVINAAFAGVCGGVWGRTLPENAASTPEFNKMFVICSVLGLVSTLVLLVPTCFCANEKRVENSGATFKHRIRSLFGSFRNVSRDLTMVLVCVFLSNAACTSAISFICTDECLGVYIGSIFISISYISEFVFGIFMPRLVHKSPKPAWLFVQVIVLPVFIILCFTPQITLEKDIVHFLRNYWWCLLASIPFGINQAGLYSLPYICIGRGLARGISQGSVCSMVEMVLVLGQAVGLLTQTGLYSIVTEYEAPFVTCTFFSVLNLVAIAFLPACRAAPEESLLEAEDKIEE